MTTIQKMLEVRRQLKARKPIFVREDAEKRHLGWKWRRPTGRHSKMKHQFKGGRKMPSCGYRAPFLVRGLTRRGLRAVVVHTPAELHAINPKTETAIIASDVGNRKRALLLQAMIENNIRTNAHDPAALLKKIKEHHTKKTGEVK